MLSLRGRSGHTPRRWVPRRGGSPPPRRAAARAPGPCRRRRRERGAQRARRVRVVGDGAPFALELRQAAAARYHQRPRKGEREQRPARREDVAIRQHDEGRGLEEPCASGSGTKPRCVRTRASRCAAARTPSASASVAGRPGDHQPQPGIGQVGERVQKRVDALVAPQLSEAHEDAVLRAEPQRAPGRGRRHVVRIAADVVPVGYDGRRAAARGIAERAASACTTSRAERTRNQRNTRSTGWDSCGSALWTVHTTR